MSSEAQRRATKKYTEKFDRIYVRVSKEEKDAYNTHANEMGESLTGFIKRAIEEAIIRDKSTRQKS